MSRGLSTAFKAALGAGVVYPALFAEFQFRGSTSRFWTGETSISADLGDGAVTWTGGGLIGQVETAGEGDNLEARQLKFSLNAVSTSYYSKAVQAKSDYKMRPCKLWFALTDSTGTSVSYYYLVDELLMDTMDILEGPDSITLIVTAETRLIDMFKPRPVFMTSDDHHRIHPDDDFYEYVPKLPDAELPWGMEGRSTASLAPGSGNKIQSQWKPR